MTEVNDSMRNQLLRLATETKDASAGRIEGAIDLDMRSQHDIAALADRLDGVDTRTAHYLILSGDNLVGCTIGEDGKAGLRGKLISKQGQVLANALLAGVASGIGSALQQSATTYSVSPLGSTSTVQGADVAKAGLGLGVGRALDRLSNYYISLAEKMFPVIEIDSSRVVEIVLQKGVSLDGLFDDVAGANADNDYPALAQRNRNSMRGGVDD